MIKMVEYKKIIFSTIIGAIIIYMILITYNMLFYHNELVVCQEQLINNSNYLNATIYNVAAYVIRNVTDETISNLYFNTNNCSIIQVNYYNNTRQLIDINC